MIDALRAARQEFNHLLDCRVSWMVEDARTEGTRRRRGAAGSEQDARWARNRQGIDSFGVQGCFTLGGCCHGHERCKN